MTEVGTLIITSKMPVDFKGVLALFLEKTIISLPIIVLLTNLFGIA
jgi:nucleoside recognition membrane protein YjiH